MKRVCDSMSWYNPKWEELSPRAKRLYILFMILIVCLVVFIVMIGTSHKSSDSKSSASRRVDLTKEMVDGLTSVIQLKGFHCPCSAPVENGQTPF